MTRMPASYTVIRYIPNTLRGEFVNLGVVLVCPVAGFQGLRVIPGFGEGSKAKLLEDSDGQFVRHALTTFRRSLEEGTFAELVGEGGASQGVLNASGLLTLHEMYHNNIQLSPPRPAVTENPEATLERLFVAFVGTVARVREPRGITRRAIRETVADCFRSAGLFGPDRVQQDWELPTLTKPTVDLAYKNTVWHCYQAISFSAQERTVTDTVNAYRQAAHDARKAQSAGAEVRQARFAVLGHVPQGRSRRVSNLLEALKYDEIEVRDYEAVEELARDIARDLNAHDLVTAPVQARA